VRDAARADRKCLESRMWNLVASLRADTWEDIIIIAAGECCWAIVTFGT